MCVKLRPISGCVWVIIHSVHTWRTITGKLLRETIMWSLWSVKPCHCPLSWLSSGLFQLLENPAGPTYSSTADITCESNYRTTIGSRASDLLLYSNRSKPVVKSRPRSCKHVVHKRLKTSSNNFPNRGTPLHYFVFVYSSICLLK